MFGTSGVTITEYSSTYNVKMKLDLTHLVKATTPYYYAYSENLQYLRSHLQPIQDFNLAFLNYRYQTLYESKITGQTSVLRKYLNTYFNTTGIQILNNYSLIDPVYIYREGEKGDITNLKTFIFRQGEESDPDKQTYLYTQTEIELLVDFIVQVPNSLITSGVAVSQIEAIINRFKSTGTKYRIDLI